jgi:hypothetical protein
MAKSEAKTSVGEALIKASAQRYGVSKKAMKKAVREAKVRLAAEKIAREQLDSEWQAVVDLSRQPTAASKT